MRRGVMSKRYAGKQTKVMPDGGYAAAREDEKAGSSVLPAFFVVRNGRRYALTIILLQYI